MITDGQIEWPDGDRKVAEGFDLNARKADIYDWVRQIRGGVLAGAFAIENNLSAAAIFFFLGDRVQLQDVQSAFDEAILSRLGFEQKLNIARTIAPGLIGQEEAKELCKEVDAIKSIRNAMAHNPFWMVAQTNDAGEVVGLVPFVRKGKEPFALTTPMIEETNERMKALIRSTWELAEAAARKSKTEGQAGG